MKNYYLIVMLVLGLIGKAQIINFTDANFKAKLLASSSSNSIAQNSNYVNFKIDANNNGEIEVSEAQQVYKLNVSNSSISNLTGVYNFSNLSEFNFENNTITFVDFSSLGNLKYIYGSNNSLNSINISGLSILTYLSLQNNQLTNVSLNNCSGLQYCYLNNNVINNISFLNNTNLVHFDCSFNNLSQLLLNNMPQLQTLYCNNNSLTTLNLNTLNNLITLNCNFNLLNSIIFSDNNKIVDLKCRNNNFISLDLNNTTSLTSLDCSSNSMLQSIFIKNGRNVSLTLSNLPNLEYICTGENQISFIQIQVSINYPNCQVNSYCTFTPGGQFYTIQGQHKFDDENNGCDNNDVFIPNLKFNISDGTTSGSIISNYSGIYSIPVQAGNHTITPVLDNPTYFNASPSNVVVNFPTQSSPYTQDFCITPNGIKHDVEVSIIPINPARPGFDVKYKIIFKNKGNQTESGTVNLQFDDTVLDLVSVNPTFSTQTLNNLNWTYSNLQPFETREIIVTFNVNSPLETPAVNAGDFLIYTAQITQLGTDEMISDNSFGLKQLVVNSYDPNDKTCLQGNFVGPDKIGEYVHYTIRFENTGTYPAQNIVVKDMIDTSKFDVSTLVPLTASHNFFTRISGNKVEFIFENINLPFNDANNDGYIAFKIKTKPTLVLGDTFSNSANIYFDYNFPITTNTYTTTIAALSNPSFEFDNYFNLYPNPTSNELTIHLKQAIEINSIQIYNTIGQFVQVQTGNASKVDVSNLKTGNYFIKINTSSGYSTTQFIKN
ncbi:Protein of unknown function [Flavobacterium indicum GPTSA100-9 = DSM 17447]|uniref:Uncharacterized protein n=1 Tax=Flavobacterium indicum (strain DSM 17447 / CIP 109464 / GPTSA100-9) TaxID=1094466 RepID=H8XV32_FLAIG|nr:T9SS type A sorting domain-containing protein [Flavobacterium indicum]CCG53002.1 Protein of unknown function [Flavobacterium indicum GPTSA100-9 = DSM 17447]